MPVKIIKVYHGTNIIKGRAAGGAEKYGYRITIDGRKYQSARWTLKSDAENALSEFRRRMRDPDRYDDVELTIDDLLAAWVKRAETLKQHSKRISEMKTHLLRLKAVAGNRPLRQLTVRDLLDYQESRVRAGKHNHTVNKEIDMIRTCLLSACHLFPGFNSLPPKLDRSQRLPALHEGREVLITPDEHQKIIEAMKADAAVTGQNSKRKLIAKSAIEAENERQRFALDAYTVAAESGMRVSEIAGLKKSQVNFTRGIGYPYGSIRLVSAKTRRTQTIPMTRSVAAILKRRSDEGEYLFKEEGQSMRMAILKIRRGFQRACERAGIRYGLSDEGIVFHTARHTLTTRLINNKVPMSTVMAITRHSKRTMLLRYSHPTPETMLEAVKFMSAEGIDEREEKPARKAMVRESKAGRR